MALMVVAIGLAALMVAVSGTARTSGMLRDKTIAEWIALNRLAEVRLNLAKSGQNTDTGELDFANRKWHYDTRYFDTSVNSMKRVVVRVYAGDAKAKGNPLVESVGFAGTQISSPPGNSNTVVWTTHSGPNAVASAAVAGSNSTQATIGPAAQGAGQTATPTGPTTTPTGPTPAPAPGTGATPISNP